MAERIYQKRDSTYCSKCGDLIDDSRIGKQRYCKKCHAEYMRNSRPKLSELTPESKKKSNARSYLRQYIKRGKIVKLPCEKCGNENSEAHHPDYNMPLVVIWMCRPCHLKHHNG